MNGAFYIGATGLQAQQRALDVVANNITNMNTAAFKRAEVRFSELVGPSRAADDPALSSVAAASLLGVAADGSAKVFAQGELRETGSPMDLAIAGDGFIELLGPAGETVLWRGGALKVNEDGFLAASNGLPLKAMISVPTEATGLAIDRSGEVRASVPGATEAESIGRIELVTVKDASALTGIDGGLYKASSDADIVPPGEESAAAIVQGSLELSNVELSEEMVALMMMQRAYAASAQIVQAGDQLMGIANGLKR
ncbi:MAG TPA: flagellar hook-basal body protein [Allosphingosinicella sp.]